MAFVVVILAISSPRAQVNVARPNFTGMWVMDATNVQPSPVTPMAMSYAIEHRGDTITIDRETTTMRGTFKARLVYGIDGKEWKNSVDQGGVQIDVGSILTWEGATLSIASTLTSAGQTLQQIEKWSLDSSEKILVADRTVEALGQRYEMKLLLAKRMTTIAQQKPDFSGEWTLNRQASVLSPIVAPAAQSGALRIEHREPSVAMQMTIVLSGKPFDTKYELLSDDREVVATDGGRRIVSRLGWDGDALVATWRIEGPDGEMTISFRYELQDGGRRVRATEQLRGRGRDQDNVWVFDRP